MKKLLMVLLVMICHVSVYGQFYSAGKWNVAKNVEIVKEVECVDSVAEDSDDVEDSEYIEESATVSDSLLQSLDAVLPLKTIRVTSPFGVRRDPFTGKARQHKGVDLYAKHEFPVSMMVGKVLRTGYNSTAGNFVTLLHGAIRVSYCHLSRIFVKCGDIVFPGTIVGLTGSTGRSTGEHLHLTIRINGALIDPRLLLKLIN